MREKNAVMTIKLNGRMMVSILIANLRESRCKIQAFCMEGRTLNPRQKELCDAAWLWVLIPVISLVGYGCASLQRAAVYPTARVELVELTNLGLDAATIEFTLGVDNPYS